MLCRTGVTFRRVYWLLLAFTGPSLFTHVHEVRRTRELSASPHAIVMFANLSPRTSSCHHCCGAALSDGSPRDSWLPQGQSRSSRARKRSRSSYRPVWILGVCTALFLLRRTAEAGVCAGPAFHETTEDKYVGRRIKAALEFFESADPTAGEAELRDVATRFPTYAQAPFYLGLISQSRGEQKVAIGFYSAALRAGP